MTKRNPYFVLLFSFFIFSQCTPDSTTEPIANTPTDLASLPASGDIMMQTFYWDVEPRGGWWKVIEPKLAQWAAIGVNRIWLPPVSKGMSGGFSMGYDPMDYYDFGEYDQMGTIPTRFGTRKELEQVIATAHQNKIEVVADIVLNHNSGGSLEFNPYRNKNTYTLFQPKSGKFPRSYEDFHPNSLRQKDEGDLFFPEQDVSHVQPNVRFWLWESDESVAKYYKNVMKFDGWRFDYVLGFSPDVIKKWMESVGGYAVAELWDGNPDVLERYVNQTGIRVFEFSTFYALEQALDGDNMNILKDRNTFLKRNPAKSVTFTANHDTEKDTNQGNKINVANKLLAYAYILTHDGEPCIYYSDYESVLPKRELERLMLINRTLAKGTTGVLFADREKYIALRGGNTAVPGLVVFLNNGTIPMTQTVITPWKNATLVDYSNHTNKEIKTDQNGRATLEAAAKNFTIWSLKKI
ncbi:MAG: alpha-amylase [Spirosomataceae bacterium]